MNLKYEKESESQDLQKKFNQPSGVCKVSDVINPLDIEIEGTFFPSIYSNQGIAFRGMVLDLIGKEVKSLSNKDNCSLYSFTTFNNDVRANDNAIKSSALVFDFDHKTKKQARNIINNLKCMRVSFILYTTYSMMSGGEIAFRVIVFYFKSVPIEVAENDYKRFAVIFNCEVDPSTKDRARIYYQRAIQKGYEKFVRYVVREGLSIEAFKEEFPEIHCDDLPLLTPAPLRKNSIHSSSRLNLPSVSLDFVFSKCEALRELYFRSKSHQLGHRDGFALVWFLMNFSGWEDRVKNMKGWGGNKKHWVELQQSYEAGYVGHNCKELINKGICKKTSSCFTCGGEVQGKFFKPHPLLFVNAFMYLLGGNK